MKDYERVETLYWANFTLADTIGVDEINKMFNTLFDECKGKGMYKYLKRKELDFYISITD